MSKLNDAIENNSQLKKLQETMMSLNNDNNESNIESVIEEKCKNIIKNNALNKIVNLEPNLITIEDNCRKTLDVDSPSFFQLMSSIKKEGLLQNIVVELRENPYRLVAVSGQRRLIASQQLSLPKIACLVIQDPKSKSQSCYRSLDENLHREDLNTVDLAEAYKLLANENISLEDIAERYEKSVDTVKRYIKIADLPENIKSLLRAKPEIFTTRFIFLNVIGKKWDSFEKLEEYILNNGKIKTEQSNKKSEVPLEEISSILNSKVSLKEKDQDSGQIIFHYKNKLELDSILQKLKAIQN